jgi:hypothetical protein
MNECYRKLKEIENEFLLLTLPVVKTTPLPVATD